MPRGQVAVILLALLSPACVPEPTASVGEQIVTKHVPVRIISVDTGLCIDVWGGSAVAGAVLTQTPCHVGNNQKWRVSWVPDPDFIPDAHVGPPGPPPVPPYVQIKSALPGSMCIGVDASHFLALWSCTDTKTRWELPAFYSDPRTGPTHLLERLVNRSDGRCADVPGGDDAVGIDLQTYGCNGGTNQKWLFAPFP